MNLTTTAILLLLLCSELAAQVCRISTSGLTRNRRVAGPIHAECPISIHSVPFGNWGVTSNFGQKQDGNQFQGWCHETRVCDNNGNCSTECRDGWYEWNSCTDISQYRLRIAHSTTTRTAQRRSARPARMYTERAPSIYLFAVRHPAMQGALSDQGGCAELKTFDSGVNFMSLYEVTPEQPMISSKRCTFPLPS